MGEYQDIRRQEPPTYRGYTVQELKYIRATRWNMPSISDALFNNLFNLLKNKEPITLAIIKLNQNRERKNWKLEITKFILKCLLVCHILV